MKIIVEKTKVSKKFIAEQDKNPDRIEYYFMSMEGEKIAIFPYERILGDTFINCFRLDNKQELTIHRNRLQWKKIEK